MLTITTLKLESKSKENLIQKKGVNVIFETLKYAIANRITSLCIGVLWLNFTIIVSLKCNDIWIPLTSNAAHYLLLSSADSRQ